MRGIARAIGWGALVLATSCIAAEPAGGASSKATSPQPKIQVDKPVYDFGTIWNDEAVEYDFEVKNVGEAPLQIKQVRSTCGCMPVQAKPQTLQPGASTKFKIRLNARNLTGDVKKSVYVESNDPKTPRCPLTLAGKVRTPITMTPAMAQFPRVDRKAPSTLELTLVNNLDEPIALSDPTSTLSNVMATVTELEKGKKFKVTLTAKPPYAGSSINGSVTLKTGHPKRPVHTITFFGRLPSPIEIQPTRVINLGDLDNGKEYKKTVRIISTDDSRFDLTEVSTTNWRFTPVVREITERQEYEVEITARPPYQWEINRAYITFNTSGVSTPKLAVQVYGRLPRPIAISPASLLFRNLTPEGGGQASVTVKVEDNATMAITSAKSSVDNVKTKIETLEDGKSYRLVATAVPPFKPGRLDGEIVLTTTHPKVKTLTVPIQSFPIRPPLPAVSIIPDPKLIVPGPGTTTQPVSSRFIVRANRDERVRVTKVEVSNAAITTAIEPYKGAEDRMTFVRVTIPSDAKLNPQGETITIYTDNAALPKATRTIVQAGTVGAVGSTPPHGGARVLPRSPHTVPKSPEK